MAAIVALLVDAAATDPVAAWLVPDPAERQDIFHRVLPIEVDHAVEFGTVDVTLDMTAVAVWHHHPAPEAALLADHHLGAFTGMAVPRFQRLHTLVRRYRSDAPHHWLAWLYVAPGARGHGFGRALLAHHHQRVDQIGYPVDTLVTATTARDHLVGQGYRAGVPLHLLTGPQLWPLHRAGRPVPPTMAG
ncbi:N-acetyltransferase [Micromonospora zingiberis]|uniref:N-acetyltransferase n=1 Tax=Micromonospora zingiberis TaxID=2053011 RepID=A0A4R0G3U4_9ACTN|nr:GNAT family N-acetyltransferase [Micromonospora zingiberis]TCB89401.1 N-acetyltransferase [Micromonospora zingiberis]